MLLTESKEVVIVDYLRTPISRSRPTQPERDVFHEIPADILLSKVIKEIISRAKFEPSDIDEVITGCANQVKENFLYGGRHPIFLGELAVTTAAMGVDRQCGSSMTSVHIGAMEIMTGNSEIVLACGMEHMTRIPRGTDLTLRHTELGDKKRFPNHAIYDLTTGYSMLQTAQQLWEQNPDITREDMDLWSLNSHNRAIKARDKGFFDREILPIEGTLPDGSKKLIKYDQSMRGGSTLETMQNLPVVSKGITKEPQITAGNSSPLNAGAGCCVLMSGNRAEDLGIKPMVKIRSMGWAGVNPGVMGQGPVPASKKALNQAGLNVDDIDFWEINEAFAIVPLYAMKILNIPPEKVNVKGGAIALGHPLGMTGVRLVGTLARILNSEGGKIGLATACVGGGQGVATIIEKI
ncbi:MAG: acetyl-CoA C-acetyltransferase [Promethearchaeota archaeon]|nr:MAG: acetyl-CoA C-acetyltransferase [Candidatus Lokiarchaeota archaeon]